MSENALYVDLFDYVMNHVSDSGMQMLVDMYNAGSLASVLCDVLESIEAMVED